MTCIGSRRASPVGRLTRFDQRARWRWPLVTACLVLLGHTSNAAAQVSYEVVADLETIGGAEPQGGLIAGSDGALYGTASRGGPQNCGLVYRIDAPGAVSALHVFDGPGGCQPMGELVVGPDGVFYGVTFRGGDADPALGGGTIYRLALDGTHTVLHRFTLPSTFPPRGRRSGPRPRCCCIRTATSTARRVRVTSSGFSPDGSSFQTHRRLWRAGRAGHSRQPAHPGP